MSNNDRPTRRIEIEHGSAPTADQWRSMYEVMKHETQSALALYRVMEATGDTARNRILAYRCAAHRCLLLDIFNTPQGPAAYIPRHRLSPEQNASTAESARSTRTVDGERRWVEHADLLMSDGMQYWLNCDHTLNRELTPETVRADIARHADQVLLD